MTDNKQIKDGLGNLFTIRMRDLSAASDGTVQRSMVMAQLSPVDYGAGGSYHRTSKSGKMSANAAASSPIYSFQWPSVTSLALIRRIRLSAWSVDVGFVAGLLTFDLVTARAFTAQMAGGTQANLGGNSGKLRTSMGSSQANVVYANTAPLTGGTFTPDPGPGTTDTWATEVGANPYTLITPGPMPVKLFEKAQGEMPLLLAQNEGFIVEATVPQNGTWSFTLTSEWEEVSNYGSGY
jgi:hypothetical protein